MAKLAGEVYRNGDLVNTLENSETLVKVAEKQELNAYFKPEANGDYTIKRWVEFEGKKLPIENLEFTLEISLT